MTCPRSHSELVAKARLEPRAPECPGQRPAPRDSPSHRSRAWAEPGLRPREPWRPRGLLQRAQAGSYSQAETCRILLCTTRQQHPCAGTDRNKAQVGKAKGHHCGLPSPPVRCSFEILLHFPLRTRSALEGQGIREYVLPLPGIIHSLRPQLCPGDQGAGSAPGAEGEGCREEKDKIPVLKAFTVTGNRHVRT